ncbi:sensor histidine kinase [Allonocardiopsis opalescens]|uniref:histidine kinase n=1 Tax=Allonocardiopsis opalescens TaxID=1144618 RepID=A0A2T0Q2Q1_9ACTN|nr:sensor histidine kinase [Allonocardiopsis opalescens]PRX98077.1 signal transduction histidine kinase [Allonocardiopsis opalescens]
MNTLTARSGLSSRLVDGLRSAGYLTVGMASAIASLLVPPLLMVSVASFAVGGLGLLLFPRALAGLRLWADVERRRVGRHLGVEVPLRHRPLPRGIGAQFRRLRSDALVPRELGWVVAHVATGLPLGFLGLFALIGAPATVLQAALWWVAPAGAPVSMLGLPVTDWTGALVLGAGQLAVIGALLLWATSPLARLQARMARALLGRSVKQELAERVETLTETRADALHAHASELRRIERDLHDGTQARLVALAMRLGLAERTLNDDPEKVAALLRDARSGAEEAMTELRQVIRTMYPPILTDRGLVGAASALVARSAVPARLDAGELGSVPAAVEATAYFVVAEALTNAAKHSAAGSVTVGLERRGDRLHVEVVDDGLGGADAGSGTGVSGMARRVAALDGEFTLHSPVGGPTTVRAVLPCGS